MPDKLDDIEIRSEVVQEILTAVPSWMIRWGNLMILILILMLLCISWFVKYPDVISTDALITTQPAPQKIYANTTGYIDTLFVANGQSVKRNTSLAIIRNTASYDDVMFLKSIIDTLSLGKKNFNFPIDDIPILLLGDIDPYYTIFENNYLKYRELRPYSNRDFSNRTKAETSSLRIVFQSFRQLQKEIREWEMTYVLSSNTDGSISFSDTWDKGQMINQGDLVFNITPENNAFFIARLKTPTQNFGKIKVGQKVYIDLESYPGNEFGVLQGNVESISYISNEERYYLVNVLLPSVLKTSYKKEIILKGEMKGSAEIITEDLRLLQRFFNQFRNVFEN